MVNVRKQNFIKGVQLFDKEFDSKKEAMDYIVEDARDMVKSLNGDWSKAYHVEYVIQVPDENLISCQVGFNRKQEMGVHWKQLFKRYSGFIKF